MGIPQGYFVLTESKKSRSYCLAGGNVRATCPATCLATSARSRRREEAASRRSMTSSLCPRWKIFQPGKFLLGWAASPHCCCLFTAAFLESASTPVSDVKKSSDILFLSLLNKSLKVFHNTMPKNFLLVHQFQNFYLYRIKNCPIFVAIVVARNFKLNFNF